jgi:tetratricopeptide (TPR) repeat protein
MNVTPNIPADGSNTNLGVHRKFYWLLILALVLASMRPVTSAFADPATDFDAANRLYEEGKYSAAEAAYDKLLANGTVSEALYFNRGNAFLKMNRLGRAIASYREAERLSPRDRQLHANLHIARTHARGGTPDQTLHWSDWLGILSLNEWTCLTAIAFWLLFIFLIFGQWRPGLKEKLRNGVLASGLALLIFGIGLGTSLHGFMTPSAIVVAGEADARNGPLDESQSIFKVRDGAELDVVDHKNGWLQVTDAAQRTGWLRQNQVILFGQLSIEK